MSQPRVPNSFSLKKLEAELVERGGKQIITSVWYGCGGMASTPGTGCPCDDCRKDRAAALSEVRKGLAEENQKIIHQNCPQRAAHDLNKVEEENQPSVATSGPPGTITAADTYFKIWPGFERQ